MRPLRLCEDQAPTSSRAIWSADTVTWSSYALEGEAYEEPGISPDGVNAVWPQHGGYITRTAAGFAAHPLDTDGEEYTVTATITDPHRSPTSTADRPVGGARLVVLTRTGDAEPTRQELPLASACSDSNFANVDSDTTWFGDFSQPGPPRGHLARRRRVPVGRHRDRARRRTGPGAGRRTRLTPTSSRPPASR